MDGGWEGANECLIGIAAGSSSIVISNYSGNAIRGYECGAHITDVMRDHSMCIRWLACVPTDANHASEVVKS